jgi:putative (di)nucleoside polyphosphate hydrolase
MGFESRSAAARGGIAVNFSKNLSVTKSHIDSCIMHTMKITQSAGGVIVNDEGKVVVVEQKKKHVSWSLPKGHIENDEDFLTAAKREIQEETGLTELELVKEFPMYERYKIGKDGQDDMSEKKRMHFFLFTTQQKELKPQDPENPQARWVEKSEVPDILTHEKDKEFFRSIVGQI